MDPTTAPAQLIDDLLTGALESATPPAPTPAVAPTPTATPAAAPTVTTTPAPTEDGFNIADYFADPVTPTGETTPPAQTEPAPASTEPTTVDPQAPIVDDPNVRLRMLETQLLEERTRNQILMQQQLVAQQAQQAQQVATPPVPEPTFFNEGEDFALTPEEQVTYGQSAEVIQKIARQMLKQYHDTEVSRLQDRLQTVHGSTESIQQQNAAVQEKMFMAQVEAAVPDMSARVKGNGWQQYLQTPLPFSGGQATIGQRLQQAAQAKDVRSTVDILMGYNKPTNPAPSMVSPGTTQTTVPSTSPRVEQKFAYSKYVEASEKAQKGLISYEEYEKVQHAFFDADSRGAIDYNA